MFRFTHISDTHGMFPSVPATSLAIIHAGDMAPNFGRGNPEEEIPYQKEWWWSCVPKLKEVIADRIFLFIPGNHDFYDPEDMLRNEGFDAHNLHNRAKAHALHKDPAKRVYSLFGTRFYGFPYIPYIAGEWNYEVRGPEMSKLVSQIPECDILVAHCPPFGICAETIEGKGGGNSQLLNWLSYEATHIPQYLLCGHFHESRGIQLERFFGSDSSTIPKDLIISNAATVQHTFHV